MGSDAAAAALALSEQLRDTLPQLRLVCHGDEGSFKAKMRAADRSAALFAVIVGDEELSRQVAGLKPLRGQGEQQTVAWSELADRIAKFI